MELAPAGVSSTDPADPYAAGQYYTQPTTTSPLSDDPLGFGRMSEADMERFYQNSELAAGFAGGLGGRAKGLMGGLTDYLRGNRLPRPRPAEPVVRPYAEPAAPAAPPGLPPEAEATVRRLRMAIQQTDNPAAKEVLMRELRRWLP
jgi:hypothetical protein